jgi:hypothetical protein
VFVGDGEQVVGHVARVVVGVDEGVVPEVCGFGGVVVFGV